MPEATAENLIRIGMFAVIRDVQQYIEGCTVINADELRAYLLGQLIIAGGHNGQG